MIAASKEVCAHRKLLDWIGTQLGVQKQEDWYSISSKEVLKQGGTLLKDFNNSLSSALRILYPEYEWNPFLLSKHSLSKTELRKGFDWFASQLGIETQQEWYTVTKKQVEDIGGYPHLHSMYKTMKEIYPEYEWYPFLFDEELPKLYWTQQINHKKFFDYVAEHFAIRNLEDWYRIKRSDVVQLGGESLLTRYEGSLYAALKSVYQDFDWNPTMFLKLPQHLISNKKHHRKIFDEVASRLGITQQNEWYSVNTNKVKSSGGGYILYHYKDSLQKALQSIYPEFEWKPFLFGQVSRNYWKDKNNQRNFMDYLISTHNIRSPSQWFDFSYQKLRHMGAFKVIRMYRGGLVGCLETLYPEHDWSSLVKSKSQGQDKLAVQLQKLIKSEVKVEHKLKTAESNMWLELDVYIPEYNLAFEYQGLQHYADNGYGSITNQQKRDVDKKRLCKELGITLIEVPYWWDYSLSSLVSSVHRVRPDIKLDVGDEVIDSQYSEHSV